ncbi:MAG: hypothetical protein WAT39_11430, partial [Planctomycetota bacterium]
MILAFALLAACGTGGTLTGGVDSSAMVVGPEEGLTTSGEVGGTFAPDTISYQVANEGDVAMSWQAVSDQGWV